MMMGQMLDHFQIPTKRKASDESAKSGHEYGGLVAGKTIKVGNKAKTNVFEKSVAKIFPRKYVAHEDSDDSESSNDEPTHHAMFSQMVIDPRPTMTVKSTDAVQNGRRVVNT